MKHHLSKEKHSTFVGDVFSLRLIGSEEGALPADITFRAEGDGLRLRDFKDSGDFAFSDGVLITVLKPGIHTVFCEADGEVYTCTVDAHPMEHATSEEANLYFRGDMHAHTSRIHSHDLFAERTVDFPEEYVAQMRKEDLLDFGVISDHAETINDRDFFRDFTAVEESEPMRTLIFPGAESEVLYLKENRFGIPVRKSGEILTMNADDYILAKDFDEFRETFKNAPAPIVIFAHPQVFGGLSRTIWDFEFPTIADEEMKRIACGIEVIDSGGKNLAYEQSYSYALDSGFRVSPYADGDLHSDWIEKRYPYRSVLMATAKTKEALLDAIRSGRAYATESGKVKLRYSVNGKTAPADLSPATDYHFHIELDTFDGDDEALPVSLRVISDYGNTVYEANCENQTSIDFTLHSETARYFYLRFLDKKANRTISCPVYTGRALDDPNSLPKLKLVPADGFTATEAKSGKDASEVINGDPYATYHSNEQTASILIDMKETKRICAVGLLTPYIRHIPVDDHFELSEPIESIPADVAVYTSSDGVNFEKQADFYCRIFGDESFIRFAPTEARYLRFDVLSNVGVYSGKPQYADAKTGIGNLSIFTDK